MTVRKEAISLGAYRTWASYLEMFPGLPGIPARDEILDVSDSLGRKESVGLKIDSTMMTIGMNRFSILEKSGNWDGVGNYSLFVIPQYHVLIIKMRELGMYGRLGINL